MIKPRQGTKYQDSWPSDYQASPATHAIDTWPEPELLKIRKTDTVIRLHEKHGQKTNVENYEPPSIGQAYFPANSSDFTSSIEYLQIASPDIQADYLLKGFWRDTSRGGPRSFNLAKTNSEGTGQLSANTLIYDYNGFFGVAGAGTDLNGLTDARRILVDRVLQDIGSKFGITFRIRNETRKNADKLEDVDIFFKDNEIGAHANYILHSNKSGDSRFGSDHKYIDYTWVNVAGSWNGGSSADNDHTYSTIYHEVLHAVGLGHSGPYNGDATYVTTQTNEPNTNKFLNDSWQLSIMSYIDPEKNTWVSGSKLYQITAMSADIQALRTYYGSGKAFMGDTIYGFNTNISEAQNYMLANLTKFAGSNMFCIVDDGGNDTFDFSGFSQSQWIDLSIVNGSSTDKSGGIHGMSGVSGEFYNLSIAPGCVIENAFTGSGNDGIIGNSSNNRIVSGLGQDMVKGMGGRDTITTGGGADLIGFDFGMGDSLASSPDSITDFSYLTDKLYIGVGPTPVSLERISNNSSANSTSALASNMFSGLGANQARLCVSDNSKLFGNVYIAVNDGSSIYSENDDLFIQLSAIGGLPSIGSVSVGSLFNV